MSKISASSLRNLCRTCMTTIANGKKETTHITFQQYIYEKPTDCDEGPTIMEILTAVQPQIKVGIEDDLPKVMCIGCIQHLQMTYDFLEMYKEANEKFHKLLKEIDLMDDELPAEAVEFENSIEYDGAEKEHVDEEEEGVAHVAKYEIQIEKIPADTPIRKDTLAIEDEDSNMHDWPEFEEEPVHDISAEDEQKTTEYFGNPYSDASGDEWTTHDSISNNKTFKQSSPRKRKPVVKSSIRNQKSKKKVKRRVIKEIDEETVDDELPTENEDGSISCQECDIVLESLLHWREHMREHRLGNLPKQNEQNKVGRPKKSYECEYCGKVFPKITAYKNHVRIHTGEEPYLCIECGKSFKVVSSLNTHMLRHRGDKKFQCPHCPKKFVCSSGLYGHMMVHNKEKPFVCDICGSAFHMAYMLKKHNLYHKGIKNFPCEYCDLRFVTAEKQRRHMRTHTGEKPYRCKYCDRAFAQSNDCNKHLKQHLGDNIYQCELCPLRFPLARDLRVHFATHKDDDEETRMRNLEARVTEENNLKIKLGIKEC